MSRAMADPDPKPARRRRPGPQRTADAPAGREAVRGAVLETAARLFGERGVVHVSLRDIAGAANVQLALIGRYVGNRAEVVDEVFRRVSAQVAEELEAKPLQQLDYGPGSTMGQWMAVLCHYAIAGQNPPEVGVNPIRILADTFETRFGIDPATSKVRASQVAATAIGWRIFEEFLVASAELEPVDLEEVREDLTAIQLQIASTPRRTPRPES